MPTYDYECGSCGHAFELFQPMSASPVRKCPSCGKLKVRRLIGIGAGVIFKGSGFYCTDYRGDSYRQAAKKDSADGTSTGDSAGSASGSGGSSSSSSGDNGGESKASDSKTSESKASDSKASGSAASDANPTRSKSAKKR